MFVHERDNGNIFFKDRLEKVARVLDISVDEVVDRYIRRGLYEDDFYIPPKLTSEDLDRLCREDAERRKKRGPNYKRNRNVFLDFIDDD